MIRQMSCCKGYPRVLHCIAASYCDILRPSASMYVSYTKGQANEHSLICSRRPCWVSLQLSSCDIAAVLSSIQNLKDPDNTAPFSSLGPALLQMIHSYYGVFAWKASHSQHDSHT